MRRQRQHPPHELTGSQLEFLLCGLATMGPPDPFADDDAAAAWAANREFLMSLRDIPDAERILPGASWPSGTRPYGFWLFDLHRQPPRFQFAELDRLGLMEPSERAAAIALARTRWVWYSRIFTAEWQARAQAVADEQLLAAWPELPELTEES